METGFAPPLGITIGAVVLGALFAAILPTCLLLYVEPRSRLSWGVLGDTMKTRRAPLLVRTTAWLSFAVGQLALPALLVPAACAALVYVQLKTGLARPVAMAATVVLAAAAVAQSALALRLLPMGVRLLARDAAAWGRAGAVARAHALASAAVLAVVGLCSWGMTSLPGLVHPWLRTVLVWTAVRPTMGYAGVCLLHSLLLGRCAQLVAGSRHSER